ncbi:hypothetical protein, partial [Dickeya dadantii]|uniref:hypothetical protein n=1 Tax=Dickeya dadantii TaxID=204038 RepID=UPI001C12FA5A
FEPLLVVRAMKWQRNDTVYSARNYPLTWQTSPLIKQHGCLLTAPTGITPFTACVYIRQAAFKPIKP